MSPTIFSNELACSASDSKDSPYSTESGVILKIALSWASLLLVTFFVSVSGSFSPAAQSSSSGSYWTVFGWIVIVELFVGFSWLDTGLLSLFVSWLTITLWLPSLWFLYLFLSPNSSSVLPFFTWSALICSLPRFCMSRPYCLSFSLTYRYLLSYSPLRYSRFLCPYPLNSFLSFLRFLLSSSSLSLTLYCFGTTNPLLPSQLPYCPYCPYSFLVHL